MQFGAHISAACGWSQALAYAIDVGCECVQLFAKSPRQWKAPAMDESAAARFVAEREAVGFGPLFTHTAYLLNLATTDEVLREKSIDALADELLRGALLGAEGVVTHTGTAPDGDRQGAAVRLADSVVRAIMLAGGEDCRPRLLLENAAGQGRSFGGSAEELGAAIALTGLCPERLGVCIDTCHGFAYGMELDIADGWDTCLAQMDDAFGLERLGLIHANDCKFGRGEHRDRHEWIGDGFIGTDGFSAMVCHPALAGIAVITEMPGDPPYKDAENLRRLRALRAICS